jgi:small subunit ribosomal protein S6
LRDYELVVIVSPEAGEEGFPGVVDRITNFITERGGVIKKVDPWGRRRLAYPIKRNLDGYYAVTQFQAEPQVVRPLEANLDLAEDILRHLVIKLDEEIVVEPEPAPAASPAPAVEPEAEPAAEPVAAAAVAEEE